MLNESVSEDCSVLNTLGGANLERFLAAAFNLPAALILTMCSVEKLPTEVSQSTPDLALHTEQMRDIGLILRPGFIMA
jgi:hypothetical protein